MKPLFTAFEVLDKITKEHEGFSTAISGVCKTHKIDEEHRKDLSSLVGCALRHYLILNYRYSLIENREENHANAFILAASNLLFTKKVNHDDTSSFLKETCNGSDLYKSEMELINKFLDGEELIPADLDPNCLEFLSFRYNTPLWMVKMWRKHYGYKIMRKLLIGNSKHFSNFARTNPEYISDEQFETENPHFTKTNYEHFYHFEEKNGIKKTNAFVNKQIFVYPIPFDEIIKLADTDSFRGIAAYSSTPNSLISALAANLSSYVEMDYIIGKQQAYFDIKTQKTHYNLKNCHLYEGQPSTIVTCVSKPVHTFFVIPESSNFFLLRNTPDYFVHFDQNSLDGLLEGELNALNEAAAFVENGGYIAYIIPTISEKESHGIIKKFMEIHPEFSLVKDEQIFPFSEFDTSLFYAVLRKEIKND